MSAEFPLNARGSDAASPLVNAGTADEEQSCWICLDGPEAAPLHAVCQCPSRLVHELCLAKWCLHQAGKMEETRCRFCFAQLPDHRHLLRSALQEQLGSAISNGTSSEGPSFTASSSGRSRERAGASNGRERVGEGASEFHKAPATSRATSGDAGGAGAPGVMVTVQCGNKAFRMRMLPGESGRKAFERNIRQVLGYSADAPLEIDPEFELPDPTTPVGTAGNICLSGMRAWDAALFCAEVSRAKTHALRAGSGVSQRAGGGVSLSAGSGVSLRAGSGVSLSAGSGVSLRAGSGVSLRAGGAAQRDPLTLPAFPTPSERGQREQGSGRRAPDGQGRVPGLGHGSSTSHPGAQVHASSPRAVRGPAALAAPASTSGYVSSAASGLAARGAELREDPCRSRLPSLVPHAYGAGSSPLRCIAGAAASLAPPAAEPSVALPARQTGRAGSAGARGSAKPPSCSLPSSNPPLAEAPEALGVPGGIASPRKVDQGSRPASHGAATRQHAHNIRAAGAEGAQRRAAVKERSASAWSLLGSMMCLGAGSRAHQVTPVC